jgi:cytochrome c-type biogenesis protein CcmH
MTMMLVIGLIAVLATASLVLHLRAPTPATGISQTRRAKLQANLADLDAARADGVLDAASFADERCRIEADLASLPADDIVTQTAAPARTAWPVAIAVMILLPASAVGIYAYLQGPFWQTLDTVRNAPAATAPVDPAAMVARLEARLAENGNDVEGWKRLGRSYVVLGRAEDARRAYDRAAQLAPDDLTILDGYSEAAEPGAAPPPGVAAMLASIEAQSRAAPDNPRAWVRLGFARSVQGDRAGARDAYAQAYQLDPQRPEVLAAYAASEYALDPQRPSPRAVELYQTLLATSPDNGSALWVLGQAAQLAGHPDQARAHWQNLLKQLPEQSPLRAQVQRAIDNASAGAKD